MRVPLMVRAVPTGALRAWFTPPPLSKRRATVEAEALAGVERVRIPVTEGDLAGFSVGTGPLVIAAHGWGGRAAQMLPLAEAMAGRGMRVVAFDLPGHRGGDKTDVKAMASALSRISDELGPPRALLAHSLGAMAARLAFRELAPPRVVLFAPLLVVSDALDVFSRRAGLLPWADRGLREGLRSWDATLYPWLDDLATDQMPGAEMLILHDPADPDTPFSRSAELAALREGTQIVPLNDLGHTGALSDPDAVELASAFLTSGSPGSTGARGRSVTTTVG